VERSGTILLVEDEDGVRRVLARFLLSKGFEVLCAENARAAQPIWREHQSRIGLLLTDVMLPGGMSGCDLARTLQTDRNDLSVIFTSGYNTEFAEFSASVNPGTYFIPKPYRPDQLLELIDKAFQMAVQN
jgi:two-component system, cell cycle sensor histidine kinase and response regulator CckA